MTTANAKTIQIYLPTGAPRGIRIADITTRLVFAVLNPRSGLAAGKLRSEPDHPGVYFLFGEDEDGAKPIVYIGQTEDARKRFDAHNKNKTFCSASCDDKRNDDYRHRTGSQERRCPNTVNGKDEFVAYDHFVSVSDEDESDSDEESEMDEDDDSE